MHVIGGTASTALAERVSRELGNVPFGIPFTKRFPDDEMYVRVGGRLEGEDVVLVQSTRTDSDFLELVLLEDAIREAGARRTFVVVPYFGYARQDRRFFPGEPVSARALCRHVELDADAVVTVDLHSSQSLTHFTKPAFEASGIPAVARLLRERPLDLLVSRTRAESIAHAAWHSSSTSPGSPSRNDGSIANMSNSPFLRASRSRSRESTWCSSTT